MGKKLSVLVLFLGPIVALALGSCSTARHDVEARFKEWRNGVWISGGGTYTIYTDTHYFVVSFEGDTASANVYCGASQVQYCSKGMARKQVIRLRQMAGHDLQLFKKLVFDDNQREQPLEIDTTLFVPGVCNIKDGVIYDSITEVTDEYILLATCNGDQEKIFANGVSVYLPADGGEFYSYRVEGF